MRRLTAVHASHVDGRFGFFFFARTDGRNERRDYGALCVDTIRASRRTKGTNDTVNGTGKRPYNVEDG